MFEPLLQLVTPGIVAMAMGAIGIIALIHWLARDRTPAITLPTARFIPRGDSAAITRRWRDALMFGWRSVFALLCIAAIGLWLLPRPQTPGAADPSAHDPRMPLVIVLDGSGSMREPLGAGTRFDAARAAAAEAINAAAERERPTMLILAQRQGRAIPPLLSTDAAALVAALNALEANDAHADLARAMAHAGERLEELRIDRGDLLLLTDGQHASGEGLARIDADPRARWRNIEARSFAAPRTEPRLWWVAEDPADAPAFAQRITLGIDNPSDEPRTVTLTLRTTLGTDRQRLALAPNDTQTLTIPIVPTEPGPWEAIATLDSAPDAPPLRIVGHTPAPIEVWLLDDAAERYAAALDPRDPDDPNGPSNHTHSYWPFRISDPGTAGDGLSEGAVARHFMPHEQPPIHIARVSTILSTVSLTPPTPKLLLADSAREIELIAASLGITIPTIAEPRTATLASPARAAGLSLNTQVAPQWWPRSLDRVSVAATDDLGRPLALRADLFGAPTIVLLGEPDRRDVRLPLLLLELLGALAPAQPSGGVTILAGQSGTLAIAPVAARQLPITLVGPNDEALSLITTPRPEPGLLQLATPPMDAVGLWRIVDAEGALIATIGVAPDPRELDATMIDAPMLRAWLGVEEPPVGELASGIRDQASSSGTPMESGLPLMLFLIALVLLITEPLLGRLLGDVARPMTMLTALRLLAVLMLLASAWLAWQRHRAEPIGDAAPAPAADRPTLHILLDRSESMRPHQTASEAWIRAAIDADLEAHARPRIVPFPDAPPPDRSPMLDAIDAALAEALPGDALVVLSDGADTTADPLRRATRAERLAQQAAALGIPIHAAPLGPAHAPNRDDKLHASVAIEPTTITPGTPAVARIEIHAVNPGDPLNLEVPTRVRVIAASPALGDPSHWADQQTLLEATLPVPPGGLSFELPLTPGTGQDWLAVQLLAEPEPLTTGDPLNSIEYGATETLAIARIDREPKRILLLEGNPAPATRRTIQALARTAGILVEAGQSLGPRIDFARWQLDPDDPANLQRTTNLPWPPAFAPEPDLIILGNRLDRLLTPSEAAGIAAWMERGTPVVRLNPVSWEDDSRGNSAAAAILAEALEIALPEPLFVDDRVGTGDDRWIGAFIARVIDPGVSPAPIRLLTPARPVRPGASVAIGVLLADPEAPAPSLRYTPLETNDAGGDPRFDLPLPLTRSPGTPGLWLGRLPAQASIPTFNTPAARPFRVVAETTAAGGELHAAEAWLGIDGRSPEAARGLRATDHDLLFMTAERSGGVFFLEPEDVVELFASFREQEEAGASGIGGALSRIPVPRGMIWLVLAAVGAGGLLAGLWTARRWRGLV